MSRQPVLAGGFLPHGHGHGHGHGHNHVANGHYGVHAQSAYENAIHSGLAFGRPLPIRAPVLAPAFNLNHQHTGQHQHQHPHGRNPNFAMADQQYMPSDDDYAHLQKLSSEFEPEVAVSALPILPARLLACLLARFACRARRPPDAPPLTAPNRARLSASARAVLPSPRSTPTPTPSTGSRRPPCLQNMPTSAPAAAMAIVAGEVSCSPSVSPPALPPTDSPSHRLHLL
jgi:hypothetical protein